MSKDAQGERGRGKRSFQRDNEPFWKPSPILPACDEAHHVVYMDGLWISRGKAALLIACTDEFVIGCHLARPENARDRGCLMSRIAPPDVLVCDGGGGIEKARRSLEKLRQQDVLFTYLDDELLEDGPVPSASNKIESNNAQIRAMLRNHRGMNVDHRAKAALWWCYMHSEAPIPYAQMLAEFPSDEQVQRWRRQASQVQIKGDGMTRWGTGVDWMEFHASGPSRIDWQ